MERKQPETWREKRCGRIIWLWPFLWIEWLCEWAVYRLGHWAFLEILEYAGRFTVLVAVILYFMSADERQKEKHYQAWQVINLAQGKPGSGGRIDALEELNRDKVTLEGVNLSGAWLREVKLPEALLNGADLSDTDLVKADLSYAEMHSAKIQGANISKAKLYEVCLKKADLTWANLEETNLSNTILDGANLTRANLQNANLRSASLRGARFMFADIKGADITGADLRGADFKVKELDSNQLSKACWDEDTKFPNAYIKPPDLKSHGCPSGENVARRKACRG